MTLKSAALLAFAGMVLVAALETVVLVRDIAAVMNGALAAMALLKCLILTFASVTLAVFLFVFYKAQR